MSRSALRAYVAAPSALHRRERVRAFMRAVAGTPGGRLTLDWIAIMEAPGQVPDADLLRDDAVRLASADINAALDADVLFILTFADDPVTSGGALVEMGTFLGLNAGRLVVVGPRLPHPLFGHLALCHFLTDEGALHWWRAACVGGS